MCGGELLTHSLVVFWDKKRLSGDNESAHSPGRRAIYTLLSFPKLTLRSNCIKVSDLVDETEAIGLHYLIPRRVLDLVTVWVSALNW